MNKATLICILFTCSFNQLYGTGQASELIIVDGDTLQMLTQPLESYFQDNEPRKQFYPFLENGCSTALWRGYIGLWKLENNQLLLIDVYGCGSKKESILNKIFPDQNRISASWFSGKLSVQHGKMILYHHSGYDRYYEEESIITVENGTVKSQEHYINGIRPEDNGFPNKPDSVQSEIYRRLNWTNLGELNNDKRLYIELKMGAIDSLIIEGKLEGHYKVELQKAIEEFPQLQKFYWRGKPLEYGYYIPIIFSRKNKRKYAR